MLRWGGEIRSWQNLGLPPQGFKEAGIRDAELKIAKALISDMTAHWTPNDFRDTFNDQVMKLVEEKADAGHVEQVEKIASEAARTSSNVVDLTELLQRSLKSQKTGSDPEPKKESAVAKTSPAKDRKAA